jgi:hypothetical protein
MNKTVKFLIAIAISVGFTNCKSKNQIISIDQIETEEPIVIRLSLEDTTVLSTRFPNRLVLKNNSHLGKSFVKMDYHYFESNSKWRNLGFQLYEVKNNNLKPISVTGKKTISTGEILQFLYYTRHYLDSSKTTQQQLIPIKFQNAR